MNLSSSTEGADERPPGDSIEEEKPVIQNSRSLDRAFSFKEVPSIILRAISGASVGLGSTTAYRARPLHRLGSITGRVWSPEVAEDAAGEDHESLANDVILRVEIASSREARVASFFQMLLGSVALIAAILQVLIKIYKDPITSLFDNNKLFRIDIWMASTLLLLLLIANWRFVHRIIEAKQNGRNWSPRRKKLSLTSISILVVQTCNVVFWLGSNVYIEVGSCRWFDTPVVVLGYLQWTCFNLCFLLYLIACHNSGLWHGRVKSKEGANGDVESADTHTASPPTATHAPLTMVVDAPVSIHIFKLPMFAAFQVFLTLLIVSTFDRLGAISTVLHPPGSPPGTCEYQDIQCTKSSPLRITVVVFLQLSFAAYLAAYLYFWRRNKFDLKRRPFAQVRSVSILFSVITYQITWAFIVVALSSVLLYLVHLDSCWTYIFVWVASIPIQVTNTIAALLFAFFLMPRNPSSTDELLQTWLQEFAWTEASLPKAIEQRNLHLPQSEKLTALPMLCVETACKLLYWSLLAYDIEETANGGPCSLDVALASVGLTDHELVWNKLVDTKCLIAWGPGSKRVVAAFKGTSSFENVKTDLRLCKTVQPPKRFRQMGKGYLVRYLKNFVQVHTGFWNAFISGGYKDTLIERLEEACRKSGVSPDDVDICFTGHSLGGALATLAAQAWARAHPLSGKQARVYTFGAPRVGNRPFAYEYNKMVPHHFAIINHKDPVPAIPKGFYKRVGQRCIINTDGDIMNRPTFFEKEVSISSSNVPGDHNIDGYQRSLCAVIASQFGIYALPNGTIGATELAVSCDLNTLLLHQNMDIDSLTDPEKKPISQVELMKGGGSRSLNMECGWPTQCSVLSIRCLSCGSDSKTKDVSTCEPDEIVVKGGDDTLPTLGRKDDRERIPFGRDKDPL